MARYGISWGNVIGHAETLQSRSTGAVRGLAVQHADFNRSEMRIYRRSLTRVAERLACRRRGSNWVDSGC